MILTYDLVSRIIMSRAYLMASFLGFSCLEPISYITATFPQMCLMLNQFLWGHSSHVTFLVYVNIWCGTYWKCLNEALPNEYSHQFCGK